ncbi:hypothetical protein BJV78DRAFT_278338 [Lactifluus subvellereus]|nr:hypothetical protein BJV78DRAFT_278338 [Lactifluus subvellereus]
MYRVIFVMVLQTLAGTLFLIRVYALYGQSRRVLGLLLVLGLGSILHAASMMVATSRSRGDIVLVVSSLHDCAQFSPPLRYGPILHGESLPVRLMTLLR